MIEQQPRFISFPSRVIESIDNWLDSAVHEEYRDNQLAQTWGRVAKTAEEAGEAIAALIGTTGQNPRKGVHKTMRDVLDELADTAFTAIFAIQHVTKDIGYTDQILQKKLSYILSRVPDDYV